METRVCCFTISVILVTVLYTRTVETANLGCQQVKYAFTTKGLHANNIPLTPQTGEHYNSKLTPTLTNVIMRKCKQFTNE